MRDLINIAEGLVPSPTNPHAFWFRFTGPKTVYQLVGHSPSNAYYGASRIIAGVYQKREIGPDELFALIPGGLFIVENGVGHTVKLEPPKGSPFEKSYGDPPESKHSLDQLAKAGKIESVEPHEGKVNWRPELIDFPEYHPQVID